MLNPGIVEARFVIRIRGSCIQQVSITPSTKMSRLKAFIAEREGKNPEGLQLVFEGNPIHFDATARSLGLDAGDYVDVVIQLLGGKPVIYLFSPETLDVSVSLTLVPEWNFSAIYPVNPIKSTKLGQQVSWDVRTHVNGDLTELTSGLDVSYLFWEAQSVEFLPIYTTE